MSDLGHNSDGQLLQFIEQLEGCAEEKADIREREKEIRAEAKSVGYDVRIIAKVLARRKRDREDIEEEEALIESYENALLV